MATSTIPVDKFELLASQEDSYKATWSLYRYGRIYLLTLQKMDQTVTRPKGEMECPFNPNAQWLPATMFCTGSITQDSQPFNIFARSSGISGWAYRTLSGQMFVELIWIV